MHKGSIFALLLIGVIIFGFNSYTKSKEELSTCKYVNNCTEEFEEWLNKTQRQHDFTHPYVKCIFDKTCEGTFHLGIDAPSDWPMEDINKTLSKYGEIVSVYCFTNILKQCSIELAVKDIYYVDNFINAPFIQTIFLSHIKSTYEPDISEKLLTFCNEDSDCVIAKNGCCTSANCNYRAVNKDYRELYETKFYCAGTTCIASICNFNKKPVCNNGKCELV